MQKHIALIEDDKALAANYAATMARQGYRVSVFADRASAEAALEQRLPDLALIDVGLKDDYEGGFELCRTLRSMSSSLPITILALSGCRLIPAAPNPQLCPPKM